MPILFIGLGIAIGCVFTLFSLRKLLIGTLRVAHDDEQPYLFLELLPGINLANRSRVMLKVDLKNDISQK